MARVIITHQLTSGHQHVDVRRPGPLTRILAALIGLVVLAVIIVIALFFAALLIPLLILLALLGLAWYVWFRIRRAWHGARAPNGVLDGRKNVRVRMPGADRSEETASSVPQDSGAFPRAGPAPVDGPDARA